MSQIGNFLIVKNGVFGEKTAVKPAIVVKTSPKFLKKVIRTKKLKVNEFETMLSIGFCPGNPTILRHGA